VAAVGAPVEASANEDFVFIGRLSPEKGAAQFAEAAMAAGVKAVFVGEGPEAERIRAINPEAEVTGWLDAEGVADRIGKARAVVFPSLWYECQPLVPVEALLRGVPVICGAWGAAAEVVDHGVNGIVYDKPQVGALAKALGQIGRIGTFDSDVLAAEMAPETHLRRLLEIYEDLLARGRS
jgi:glycosyltransferase involved in cell wall biosynthesis